MLFVLQKIIARIFFPLPVTFWLAGGAGIAAWRGRPRTARSLALAAMVWLFLISWNPVGDALLGTLEGRHPPLEDVPAETTHIVVLGGGAHAEETRPAATRLSRGSQGRVLEGVRLWRAAAASRASGIPLLVLTGDSPDGRQSMASLAAETVRELGVPPNFVIVIEETYNTAQEATAVADMLEHRIDTGAGAVGRLILVTSASHMPRAAALFRRAGMDPLPAPAQYLTDTAGHTGWSYLPSAEALHKTERFFYEMLGIAWMRVRG